MKPDEILLLTEFQKRTISVTPVPEGTWGEIDKFPHGRSLAKELGISEKRAAYIFDKWCNNAWYDYGVSVMAGWLTKKGKAVKAGS